MIRINLLPYREERRAERRRQFYTIALLAAMLGLGIGALVHVFNSTMIDGQEKRNTFLKDENAKLDKDIASIKSLQEQIDALLKRKQIIESLQGSRSEAVQLFNELARKMPERVQLQSAKQIGKRVTLIGYSEGESRVAFLMRQLEESPFLTNPHLIEVRKIDRNGRDVSQFTLNIDIVEADTAEEGQR